MHFKAAKHDISSETSIEASVNEKFGIPAATAGFGLLDLDHGCVVFRPKICVDAPGLPDQQGLNQDRDEAKSAISSAAEIRKKDASHSLRPIGALVS